MMKRRKAMKILSLLAAVSLLAGSLTACGGGGEAGSGSSSGDKVIIYANSDDEAITAMKETLDNNGYKGQYTFQTFGTTELGGKMLAEGKNLEADMLCMSSYYVDSAQSKSNMFVDLKVDKTPKKNYPNYYRPILANQGAVFYNTELVKTDKLSVPKSLKDLAKSDYKGKLSVPDISGSSTAWLMIQALISEYGETETQTILKGIYANAGDNLESSGSGPIKKVLAGEAAIGFGLRHQAVMDKQEGKPIDYVDPSEGDFTLTEGVAVVNHGNTQKEQLANEMANCIISKGRDALMKYYPIALYKGETTAQNQVTKNSKEFKDPLTVDLLERHIKLSEACK